MDLHLCKHILLIFIVGLRTLPVAPGLSITRGKHDEWDKLLKENDELKAKVNMLLNVHRTLSILTLPYPPVQYPVQEEEDGGSTEWEKKKENDELKAKVETLVKDLLKYKDELVKDLLELKDDLELKDELAKLQEGALKIKLKTLLKTLKTQETLETLETLAQKDLQDLKPQQLEDIKALLEENELLTNNLTTTSLTINFANLTNRAKLLTNRLENLITDALVVDAVVDSDKVKMLLKNMLEWKKEWEMLLKNMVELIEEEEALIKELKELEEKALTLKTLKNDPQEEDIKTLQTLQKFANLLTNRQMMKLATTQLFDFDEEGGGLLDKEDKDVIPNKRRRVEALPVSLGD